MIEVLSDMPAGVVGFQVSGHLDGDELRQVRTAMSDALEAEEIRIVEVIDGYEGFGPGGLAEDLKLGFGALLHHHSAFRRIAVVSDTEWVKHAMHAFAWMVPGELKIFALDDLDAAKAWAAG